MIEDHDGTFGFELGRSALAGCSADPGETIEVMLQPEGPQRGDLPDDVAAALEADPQAGEFFDSLAQFYRKAYLNWIEATKRRPEVRADRIAEVIGLLRAGIKQRQKP